MDFIGICIIILLGVTIAFGIYTIIDLFRTKQALDQAFHTIEGFSPSQKLCDTDGEIGIAVDEIGGKLCLIRRINNTFKHKIFEYGDILSVEVFEDGYSITKTSRSSQFAGALIGGLALGGTGLLLGGLSGTRRTSNKVNRIDLRIMVNRIKYPIYDINLLSMESEKSNIAYESAMKKARHWDGVLKVLIRMADEMEQQGRLISPDHIKPAISFELKELAGLRDSGILTNDEFEAQKARILGS